MSDKKQFVILGIIAALISIGITVAVLSGTQASTSDSSEKIEKQAEGPQKAPEFELTTYEEDTVRLKDYRGKIVVLNTWASWCPFCVNELPYFSELQEAFPEKIVVIAVNRAEPTAVAKDFLDTLEVTGGMLFVADPQDTFYKAIGGFSMPETLFVDTKGNVITHKRGPLTLEEMKSIVSSELNK